MIALIPLIVAGYPPISIPVEHHSAYYDALGKVSCGFGYHNMLLTIHALGIQGKLRPIGGMFCQRNAFHNQIHQGSH